VLTAHQLYDLRIVNPDNPVHAIGQGFVQATPLQMAVAYNSIGLEGKVVQPFLIKKVIDLEGKTLRETKEKILRILQETQPLGAFPL
jgi:penicillin-binding protein 2